MARRFNPDKVLAEMERQGLSKRELGKRIHPERPESGRAHLISILPTEHRGPLYANPTQESVQRLADVLGVDVEAITDPAPEPSRVKRFFRLRARQDARGAEA